MATESPPLPPSRLYSDHHPIPPSPTAGTQDLTNNEPLPNLVASISDLRNLSTALSTFQRRYDELQQHLDFIRTAINSKLPIPSPIPSSTHTQSSTTSPSKSKSPIPSFPNCQQKPIFPNSEQKPSTNLSPNLDKKPINSPTPKSPNSSTNLLNSEQKSNNNNISNAPSTSTILEKAKAISEGSELKPDTKLLNPEPKTDIAVDAIPTQSELEQLCSTMCSRSLRKYFMTHLSDLSELRAEAPKALKFASDPAKLVLECFGRFFLQGKKAYIRNSPMIMSREASIFALECFLLMGSDSLVIKDKVKEEAETAAVAWRKRLQSEGGLTKACEIDARGLLLLISCFGIPDVFKSEDIRNLIRSSNAKGISGVLRRSSFLLARIPEIIEEMLKDKKEIEAVDIVYTFEVQDKFPPQTILSSFLSKSNENWKRKRKATEDSFATVNEDKKHLAYLKSLVKCLEDNKIDPSKSFPEFEINEKISSLEKEITVLDKNVKENMMTKKKANEVESSKRLKTQDVKKHSRFTGHVPQLQKATGEADGKSSYDRLTRVNLNDGILPGHNRYNASPSIPRGSSAGAVLLPEYATVTRAGSGGGLVAAGIGGSISAGAGTFLAPDPYAASHWSMLVDKDPYNGQLCGLRGDAGANERLISHTYAGHPSAVGYNGLYRPSQSLEGFAGLPDRPSAAVSSRGSASDLYQFADSVLESELQCNSASCPGGTLRPGVPSHHNSSYLY